MTTLTPRQLLAQKQEPDPIGLTLDIDADIPLQDKILNTIFKVFGRDSVLVGLTVIDPDGRTLGVLSINDLTEYEDKQPIGIGGELGPIDQMHGPPVVYLYRCEGETGKKHEPHQRISFSLPRCLVTGRPMKLVEV